MMIILSQTPCYNPCTMDIHSLLQSLAAGIIQGITELLPISSSGHLLLFSRISHFDLGLTEIAVLHLGTLISILIAFRDQIRESLNKVVLTNVLISAVPAGLIGFFFGDYIERTFSAPAIIVFSLFVWGIVMIFVDRKSKTSTFTSKNLAEITPLQSLVVGIAQVLALIPGTSRSGITTISGIVAGIDPQTALSFSFVAGIPLLGATGVLSLYTEVSQHSTTLPEITLATITAAVVGIAAAYVFRATIKRGILTYAGIYRIIIGIVIFLSILD